jgi:hypothetical protein
MGIVSAGNAAAPLDGAVVSLAGPVSRVQTNDGSGFYGFVDLPPGSYRVRASTPGIGSATNTITISVGTVHTSNLIVSTNSTPPGVSGLLSTNISDAFAPIFWGTEESADSVVDNGLNAGHGNSVTTPTLQLTHSVALLGLNPASTYHFQSQPAPVSMAIQREYFSRRRGFDSW